MAARKGGYDYDFVTAPPKSLECPVCLMTFRDPHVISCCGNEFCQVCIERVHRDGKPCPLCNEPNFTTMLHKKLVREVNALVVRCPQKELGCDWEGELGQVERHLNPGAGPSSASGCSYVMVECRFQCGAHLQRRMVGEHEMESCPNRPIEMQVASLMHRIELITSENKMLRQDLNNVKEFHKQEMKEVRGELSEVKKKNEQLLKAQESMRMMQDAIRVDVNEQKIHATPQPVPPFYFVVTNIDHRQKNSCGFRSEPFYSHPGGYKMVVSIYLNSFGTSQGTHLYAGVGIERGEFDDQLRWPFKGKVTIQIYNESLKRWSNEKTIELSKEECGLEYVQRCSSIQTHGSWGVFQFLSLKELRRLYVAKDSGVARFKVEI